MAAVTLVVRRSQSGIPAVMLPLEWAQDDEPYIIRRSHRIDITAPLPSEWAVEDDPYYEDEDDEDDYHVQLQ